MSNKTTITLMELIEQKRVLDKKISEIKYIFETEQTDVLTEELLRLLEERQSKMLNIEAANHASKIRISGSEVSISVAVQLRKTIKEKIDFLTSIIKNDMCKLDKIALQKQRDKYYEEYILLSLGITNNDLKVTIES